MNEIKKLPPELVAKLNAPLPKEAIAPHPTKSYLSTIKVIYIVERLNEVFGVNGWQQRNEPMESPGKMKQVHSFLDIPEYGIHLDNFGGNDNADEGDAWKGAATDALSKMASYLGIGMDVYKGLADKIPPQSTQPLRKATAKQKEYIKTLMEQKGYTLEDLAEDGVIPGKSQPGEVIEYLLEAKSKILPNGQGIVEPSGTPFDDLTPDLSSPEAPVTKEPWKKWQKQV